MGRSSDPEPLQLHARGLRAHRRTGHGATRGEWKGARARLLMSGIYPSKY